jgi:predicted SprT family Zn-dependent metalloprotease
MKLNIAKSLARSNMDKYGLSEWNIRFDNKRRRFGACIYYLKTISLSRYLVLSNPKNVVLDTILHEIAHALTPHCHHNNTWKAQCRLIGAKPERCYSYDEVEVDSLYTLVCPQCGAEYPAHRKPSRVIAHSQCCNRYNSGKYHPKFRFEIHVTQIRKMGIPGLDSKVA